MYQSVARVTPRCIASSCNIIRRPTSRRLLSNVHPAKKSRTWKGSAVRWGLAAGAVYYYNTSNVFAEEPESSIQQLNQSVHHVQDSDLPTVDAILEEKRQRQIQSRRDEDKLESLDKEHIAAQDVADGEEQSGDVEDLADEADQQGAFNPETGEINWDCPCLGGMAHGPCGEEFKAAFSCFVYSNEEPKGVECIEKFKGMQDCFRAHPETYASEFDDDEEEIEDELRAREAVSTEDQASQPSFERESNTATHPVIDDRQTESQGVDDTTTSINEAGATDGKPT